jgi:hypothetical protein
MNNMKQVFEKYKWIYEFRWFLLLVLVLLSVMMYHDLTGRRMFTTSSQQQWNSSGPGYHK